MNLVNLGVQSVDCNSVEVSVTNWNAPEISRYMEMHVLMILLTLTFKYRKTWFVLNNSLSAQFHWL